MSVSDEKAIITLEVELVSKVTGDPGEDRDKSGFFAEGHEDIQEFIDEAVNESVDQAIEDTLKEEGVDLDELRNVIGMVKDVDAKGMSNIKSMAKNPQGFMQSTIMGILGRAGPYGALAAAIIAAIASAPEMVKAIVEALGVKGAPLNQDYAFTEEAQFNQELSRAVQYRRLTGDDPIITVNTKGFVSGDADFNDNSLLSIETGRMGRVDLRQSSLGYIHGI